MSKNNVNKVASNLIEEVINNKLESFIKLADALVDSIKGYQEENHNLVQTIIIKDKESEKVDVQLGKYQSLLYYISLLDGELKKTLIEIATTFDIVQESDVKLSLPDETITKINQIYKGVIATFKEEDSKVIPIKQDLLELIEKKVATSTAVPKELMLENIRKSPIYAQEDTKEATTKTEVKPSK